LSGLGTQHPTDVSLAELAYTLQVGREAMEARLAMIVDDVVDLRDKLNYYLAKENDLDGVYQDYVPARTDRLELLTEDDEARDFIGALIKNGKLAKLAQLWVAGVDIEWDLLYPNHKPRRISLPTYPFEKKRYWIPVPNRLRPNPAPAAEARQLTESASPPLSNQMLFIEETWLEKALPVQQVNWVEQLGCRGDRQILVIYEDENDHVAMQGLLANIASILQDSPQARPLNYRFVKIGKSDRPGDGIETLTKTDQAGLGQWVQGLKRDNQLPEVIFFMQALTPSLTRFSSPDSEEGSRVGDGKDDLRFFFYLVQAFMKEAAEKSIQGYYLFAGDEAQPRLELEALSGLTRSIILENPNHHYQAIRVEPAMSAGQKAIILFNEWLLGNDDESPWQVQYRGLDRSVRALREIEPSSVGPEPVFRQGGVYLISGGLGEVGQALCEHLARTCHSTLVILARSEPDESKQRQIESIEQAGGQVSYYRVDITDRQALQEMMIRVKERVGQIDGVFHLARRVADGLIVDKDFEAFERVMAAKVEGTIHLDEVTRDEPLEFFVIFSSLAAYGLKGSPDYAYGSAFQNGFAQWREGLVRAGQRSGRTRSVCWGQWAMDPYSDESRNRLLAQLGFDFLTPDSGMPALEQCLAQERAVLGVLAVSDQRKIKSLLGISVAEARGDSSDILFDQIVLDLRHGRRRKEAVLETMATYGLDNFSDQQIDVLHSLLVAHQSNGQTAQVSPTLARKKMDVGDIALYSRPVMLPSEIPTEVKAEVSLPNDTRALILMTLQKILKLEEEDINPQESFQTYGLDSITGMQLAMALEKSSGLEILPKWLIEYPNVEALSGKLQELKQQVTTQN
ncbi:MAG TPA: SDR family NAD(P)-dependent oxidoreductase, partial [Anaerolineae bacterium]